MIELKNDNYDKTVSSTPILVVDFWAPWCGPCKALTPLLEEIEPRFSKFATFAKVNVDDCMEIATAENIRAVPTVLFFKDGRKVDTLVGLAEKSVFIDKIKNLI